MPHSTARDRTKHSRGSPQHLTAGHPTLIAPTLNLSMARTLFDPMHDEQPFCQDLTERRRTTVKFLGQQGGMTIDDTWPQTGEMRSLWKGTPEFWTREMPQDDSWKPNRHHSNILPLFRNHLTHNAVAMPPSLVNLVAQAEHERRDSHVSVVSHTKDAEEKGETRGFGVARIIERVQHPPRRLLLRHSC